MKGQTKNAGRRIRLVITLLLSAVLLSGCYASTPTLSGGSGSDYPEFPVETVVPSTRYPVFTKEPEAGSTVYTGGIIVVSGTAVPTPTVIAIHTLVPENTIRPATAVPATPTPVPTVTATAFTALRNGAQGETVRELQRQLKKLGFYAGNVDGDYGKGTEAAVKRFQAQYGLTADGVAGGRTLSALAMANETARPTYSPTPRPTAAPNYNEDTYLRPGDSGTLVKKMQDRLIELGYLAGESNGKFNNATEAALKAFQKRHTKTSDGIAGFETLDALFSRKARGTSVASGITGVVLIYGDNNSAVKALQTRLKSLGYYKSVVNGNFGPQTEAALLTYQIFNSLRADGKTESGTLEALFSQETLTYREGRAIHPDYTIVPEQWHDPTPPPVTPTPLPTSEPAAKITYMAVTRAPGGAYVVLKLGMKGDMVKTLQKALQKAGFFSGTVDGFYGEATVAAVMAFQSVKKLTVDGIAGPETQKLLLEGKQ